MNKHNTLFGQMLDAVGRPRFDALVKSHEYDKYCNGNATWMQFAAMLYVQITGANGLRSIEEASRRNSCAAYHLGLDRKMTGSHSENSEIPLLPSGQERARCSTRA